MPPIARCLLVTAVVALLTAGCGGSEDPSAGASASPASPAAASTGGASPGVASSSASTAAARQPHILVFTATGTGTVRSLTYVLDGKSTKVRSVRLPWRLPVDVPADGRRHEWSLTVTYGKGSVEVLAIFNGTVTGRASGYSTGKGTASALGSVLG